MKDVAVSTILFVASSVAWWLDDSKRRETSSVTLAAAGQQDLTPSPVHVLHFDDYPSLALFRSSAPILGLYFAAGWCDDTQKFTPLLEHIVAVDVATAPQLLHIVYISSDRTEGDLLAYKPSGFSLVPYDCVEERSRLKRTFRTCAKKEVDEIRLSLQDREFGIPALVLLESASGRVFNHLAADEVSHIGPEVLLEQWRSRFRSSFP